MSNNNQKIPCGGFRIGDGLAMDGDTLKSLGGAYVKVKVNINDNDERTFEFMDDSPLKTFEEIMQKAKTSLVTLLAYDPNHETKVLCFDALSNDSISFSSLLVDESGITLVKLKLSIDSDNTITSSISEYTLTPAT